MTAAGAHILLPGRHVNLRSKYQIGAAQDGHHVDDPVTRAAIVGYLVEQTAP
ncbi:MAG TPA: hypothetical protein PK271_10380 [Hyphomicrobium sp.]|jgi:hypothetical protein|uniref:hypothetical protein n=1 Tax=Hyphomicrobium sp. TaxID=82 RepID=UPI000B07602A|nr:hypothetical protein [Hyphomicrobium sp.]HRN88998.1 hypothetical protein [Hyphomicrobium sp.]